MIINRSISPLNFGADRAPKPKQNFPPFRMNRLGMNTSNSISKIHPIELNHNNSSTEIPSQLETSKASTNGLSTPSLHSNTSQKNVENSSGIINLRISRDNPEKKFIVGDMDVENLKIAPKVREISPAAARILTGDTKKIVNPFKIDQSSDKSVKKPFSFLKTALGFLKKLNCFR